MLCEKCNKQEALLHVTENWAGSGVSKEVNLCADCAQTFHGLAGITNLSDVIKRAPCRYCGGEPYCSGGHTIAGLIGNHNSGWMCKPCAEEYFRFLSEKWPGLGDVEITKEQIAHIHSTDKAAVIRKAEEHMKRSVAERRPK